MWCYMYILHKDYKMQIDTGNSKIIHFITWINILHQRNNNVMTYLYTNSKSNEELYFSMHTSKFCVRCAFMMFYKWNLLIAQCLTAFMYITKLPFSPSNSLITRYQWNSLLFVREYDHELCLYPSRRNADQIIHSSIVLFFSRECR